MKKSIVAESFISQIIEPSVKEWVLVEPKVLRSLGCGQVDLCFINQKGVLIILEVKNGGELTPTQFKRLKNSAIRLRFFLKTPTVELWCAKKILPNKYSFFKLDREVLN